MFGLSKLLLKLHGAASQAGDADSSRAPGRTSGLQGSVNVHRGSLLLVPQWRCISSFVFYIHDQISKQNCHCDTSKVKSRVSHEKTEEIGLSPMTKAPIPTEKTKELDNTKKPPKTSITQRLRTDLGRWVGVRTVIPLVWLNRFTSAQPSN